MSSSVKHILLTEKAEDMLSIVRIYYIYYLIRSNAADGQRTADG
jgi:hypothetical protein